MSGIHVQLAVSACDGCPVATLSAATEVADLRVDPATDRVEFVASDPPADPPAELDLVEFGGRAHGRYELGTRAAATDGGVVAAEDAGVDGGVVATGSAGVDGGAAPAGNGGADDASFEGTAAPCGDCSCAGLPAAFERFPVSPREASVEDGELLVSFVLRGHEELEAVVDGFEDAGLSVELRRLLVDRGEGPERNDVLPADLTGVTDRQAEVAAVAAERGYFESDGASAAEIAEEMDLAKSTVSEHLRIVTATLFSQLFGDGDRI